MRSGHVQLIKASPHHSKSPDCPCNPRLQLVEEGNGQIAWAYVHTTLPLRLTYPVTLTGVVHPDAYRYIQGLPDHPTY